MPTPVNAPSTKGTTKVLSRIVRRRCGITAALWRLEIGDDVDEDIDDVDEDKMEEMGERTGVSGST